MVHSILSYIQSHPTPRWIPLKTQQCLQNITVLLGWSRRRLTLSWTLPPRFVSFGTRIMSPCCARIRLCWDIDENQIKGAFNNEGQDHSPSHLKFFLLIFAKDETKSPSPSPRRPKPKKPKSISWRARPSIK